MDEHISAESACRADERFRRRVRVVELPGHHCSSTGESKFELRSMSPDGVTPCVSSGAADETTLRGDAQADDGIVREKLEASDRKRFRRGRPRVTESMEREQEDLCQTFGTWKDVAAFKSLAQSTWLDFLTGIGMVGCKVLFMDRFKRLTGISSNKTDVPSTQLIVIPPTIAERKRKAPSHLG